MIEILLTCIVFALAMLGLCLGPLLGRSGIQGSCGGLSAIPGIEPDCGGGCKRPCRKRRMQDSSAVESAGEETV
jgi:hypothetical protein